MMDPISPKSLFILAAAKVNGNPEMEAVLYKANPNFPPGRLFLIIGEIEVEKSVYEKLKIAKRFLKHCRCLKTESDKKDISIKKFGEFVETYEKYL